MADGYYAPSMLEIRGDHLYSAPGGSKVYTVDTNYEQCDCMAFVMNKNKKGIEWCKHLTAAFDFEGRPQNAPTPVGKKQKSPVTSNKPKAQAPVGLTAAEKRAQKKKEAEQEEASMAFQKVRMAEQLRRELAQLRDDV